MYKRVCKYFFQDFRELPAILHIIFTPKSRALLPKIQQKAPLKNQSLRIMYARLYRPFFAVLVQLFITGARIRSTLSSSISVSYDTLIFTDISVYLPAS